MATKPIQVERTVYELLDNWLNDTLTKTPDQARKIFADNVYQRTLSLLMGKAVNRLTPLMVEESGVLRTLSEGREITDYNCESDTLAGAAKGYAEVDQPSLRYDIWISDYDMQVRFADRAGSYGDLITLSAGSFYSFSGSFSRAEFRNVTADGSHDGSFQMVCWGNSDMQGYQ